MKKRRMVRIAVLLLFEWTFSGAAQGVETHSFTALNKAVPDGNAAGLSDVRNLTSSVGEVTGIRVRLEIQGEFNGDLYAYLRHEGAGATNFVILLNRPGRTAANPAGYADSGLNVWLEATEPNGDIHRYREVVIPAAGAPLTGSWQPDGRKIDPDLVDQTSPRNALFDGFFGTDGSGEWTLFVADLDAGGTNFLVGWELELTGKLLPEVTWPTPESITYGTPLSGTQLNASSPVAGSFTYNPPAGTILGAGDDQVLTATFTPADSAAFLPVAKQVSIDVARKILTVTAADRTKSYGASLPTLGVSYSGFANGENEAVLTTPPTLTTTATAASPVGNYPITASSATAANYTINHVAGTLSVTPAALTIAAQDAEKAYGAALPTLTAGYTGFVNGDTEASLSTPATLGTTATLGSPVGGYPITASGAISSNYAISFVDGTLTVKPAALTITAQDAAKVYGAALPTFAASYTGFVNGENQSVLTTPPTLATTATAGSPVGSYPITASGATAGNYTISYVAGTLTINKAQLAGVLASSANPALPGTEVIFTATLSAVAPGAGIPSGTVQFLVDGATLGSPAVLSGGQATVSSSALVHGHRVVTFQHGGSQNFHGVTNTLAPDQLVNTSPAPLPDVIERPATNGTKVLISELLANDGDADGDPLSFVSAGPASTAGGSVNREGDWLHYTPPAGHTNGDTFNYTVADDYGATTAAVVEVRIRVDVVPSPNLAIESLGGGELRIRFDGIPDKTYRVQFADDVIQPLWQLLGTGTADGMGLFLFTNTPPPGVPQRFYRSVYP
ncbi:MAG TPA: hypothetical protein DCY13_03255 [Verrucomicrobiales bacterium]|nr:hypothetical protein [Verrucomicrobiales bacterium]